MRKVRDIVVVQMTREKVRQKLNEWKCRQTSKAADYRNLFENAKGARQTCKIRHAKITPVECSKVILFSPIAMPAYEADGSIRVAALQ